MQSQKDRGAHDTEKEDANYVVYVKLPFSRGDFVDPPPMKWDDEKSEKLWAILSGTSADINWDNLASQFEVTVQFLLQIAAYLTERHSAALKAQMRKAATARGPNSATPSPVPGAEPAGFPNLPVAEALRRTGSAAGRTHSALSIRKDSPLPRNEPAPAGPSAVKSTHPTRPQVSRNSSAGTAVPTQAKPVTKPPARSGDAPRRRLPVLGISTQAAAAYAADESEPQTGSPAAESSSPESSSDSSSPVQSRVFRRPPRFQPAEHAGGLGDDDDEAEPAFLPFRPHRESTITTGSSGQDLGSTVRGDLRGFARHMHRENKDQASQSHTSDSSTSSAAMVPRHPTGGDRVPPGPLSPRRTAELAGRSPSGKGKGVSREGSDGTPSMGSSFSDLDDASVTQSALEEHLASRMQDGTIGSRMSTIGQAFRSRYLPKSSTSRES